MSRSNFEPFGTAWANAMQRAPIDEQRSLVRLLEVVAQNPAKSRLPSVTGLLAVAATVVCALGVGGYLYHRAAPASVVASADLAPGAWLVTRRNQKVPLQFSEGSNVVVAESSRVRVKSVDPRGAVVVVEGGSLRASIVHRKDTSWAFAAGPFNVRVTGTVLRVGWRPERQEFELSVDEGSVFAQGPLLGSGRVVSQGQSCVVRVTSSEVHCTSATPPAPAAPSASLDTSMDVSRLPLVADKPDVEERPALPTAGDFSQVFALEKAGKYAEALTVAQGLGLEQLLRSGNAETLFCLSRLGRYQGDAPLARGALVKVRNRFVKTKEAANAAFLLGRQAAPAEAAGWFSTYLAEQPQGALAREAAGRLVESYHRAGRFTEAQSAARRYLNAYPSGPHAGFAKSLLANP